MLIQNYYKTAIRNMKKNRFFTILNVFCLSLGMSITLLFVALLAFITRYDDFHPKKDRIYRITSHVKDNEENPQFASAPAPLSHKLKDEFTGIETVAPFQTILSREVIYHEQRIANDGFFAGPEFLSVFNFPFVKGSVESALVNPNSIVITETEAERIFGAAEPMGETVVIEPYGDFVVTGVLKDVPKNSHISFRSLASYSTLIALNGPTFMEQEEGWQKFTNSYVYFVISEKSDAADVQGYLNKVAKDKYRTPTEYLAEFKLQHLSEIVPGPRLFNSVGGQWDYFSLILTGGIMLIILIPACANYVNLSISQSLNRMKEIGVRKVMGGQRKQIFFQFVTETVLTMFLALALSYLIFEAIRFEFLRIIGDDLTDLNPTGLTILYFILFAILVGLVAGITPALYFSKINPVRALKGKPEQTRRGFQFPMRKVMITAQFILSMVFIMSVIIMLQQYRYSVNYDHGFQQRNILDVELQRINPEIVRNEFVGLSSVEKISMSSHVLGLDFDDENYVRVDDAHDSIPSAAISIDQNFISNMELKLLAGRDFSENASENRQFIIVNEELVKKLGVVELHAAIGSSLILQDGRAVRIGGVVKNFYHAGLTERIGCLYFIYDPSRFAFANLKLGSDDNVRDRAAIEAQWKKMGGETKFKAKFFADEVSDAYSFYFEVISIWGYLGLMAITVSCLGLLGTVVFTMRNRLKEVSIRKVVGASSQGLVYMLSKDFIILMLIASVITVPGVYLAFTKWLLPSLQHYAKPVGYLEVVVGMLVVAGLGLSTILSQTLKAANTNPVDNLRAE
jgi:putative ABC transport system permease protein